MTDRDTHTTTHALFTSLDLFAQSALAELRALQTAAPSPAEHKAAVVVWMRAKLDEFMTFYSGADDAIRALIHLTAQEVLDDEPPGLEKIDGSSAWPDAIEALVEAPPRAVVLDSPTQVPTFNAGIRMRDQCS